MRSKLENMQIQKIVTKSIHFICDVVKNVVARSLKIPR